VDIFILYASRALLLTALYACILKLMTWYETRLTKKEEKRLQDKGIL